MGNLGFGELVLILLVVLLVFGSSKLPQLGDALGKSIRNFKKAATGDDAIDVTPKKIDPGASPQTSTDKSKTAQPSAAEKKS